MFAKVTLSAQPCFVNIFPFALIMQQALEKSKLTYTTPCTHTEQLFKSLFSSFKRLPIRIYKVFLKRKVNETRLFGMAKEDKH